MTFTCEVLSINILSNKGNTSFPMKWNHQIGVRSNDKNCRDVLASSISYLLETNAIRTYLLSVLCVAKEKCGQFTQEKSFLCCKVSTAHHNVQDDH